jgi:hypothetical protein
LKWYDDFWYFLTVQKVFFSGLLQSFSLHFGKLGSKKSGNPGGTTYAKETKTQPEGMRIGQRKG